jgi:hypothetical protein
MAGGCAVSNMLRPHSEGLCSGIARRHSEGLTLSVAAAEW